MAYFPIESRLGVTAFTNKDTVTAVPFGTIIRGQDPTLGGGEFIYLPGVASTKVGSLVVFNVAAKTTTLCPHTANLDQAVAVAMSANATTANFGWYQIYGVAVMTKGTGTTIAPTVPIFISATAGQINSTASAGKQVVNARTVNTATVVSATSTVQVFINRPFMQGQIT
jgi:hypothetical protein